MEIPWLKGSGHKTGQYSTQVVQPVHLLSSMYLGFLLSVTLKSPASPYTFNFSVGKAQYWYGDLDSLGESIHIEHSLVGKVLSRSNIVPPIAAPSTR